MNTENPANYGLYRTEHLLKPTYRGDGHGRDGYIFFPLPQSTTFDLRRLGLLGSGEIHFLDSTE